MRRVLPVLGVLVAVPAFAAESWVEVRGPAFAVVSDAGERDARRVVAAFEQVRAVIREAWPWANLDPSRPITILALRDETGYRQLVPLSNEVGGRAASMFVIAPDRNWGALLLDTSRFQESDDNWENPCSAAFREYLRLVLRLNFEHLPLWLEEGLAEFWGNTVVDGDRVYLGRHINAHVWTLRDRTLMPLARLFAVTRGAPEYSENDRATPFYAEAWGLVHMLTVGSTARQGQLGRLLELLRGGRPAAEAVQQAFGDLAVLEREFESYARRGVFVPQKRPALETRAGIMRELPAAESLALRAAFLSASRQEAEAAKLAAAAIATDPGFAAGHEAKALIAWRANRSAEARQDLERAVQLPGATEFAHDLLGHLVWVGLPGTAGLERVEADFQRAVDLNPRFAKAYESLALVKAARGAPLDQTLPLAQRASALEPASMSYRLSVIRLMMRGGQLRQARTQADKVLASYQGEERKRVEAEVNDAADPRRLPAELACGSGFGPACGVLGTQYRDGTGVTKDATKAAGFFQKGCDAGHAGSCASLGGAFEDGVGVAKDLSRALALYRTACDADDNWACTRLAFALVSGDGIAQDVVAAGRLLEKSCAAADVMACAKLGSMLRTGEVVPKDVTRAETLLRDACGKKSSWGCGELAGLLIERGTPEDLRDASTLLAGACENDAPSFCATLASLLELGQGVPRDSARAAALYRRACDGGYTPACAKVGGR